MKAFANVGEFFSPAVPQLCQYWNQRSGGEATLARSQIDPIDLPRQSLPFIMLVDIERDPFRVRYRVVGTRIAALFSLDFTNHYLDRIGMPGSYQEAAADLYRLVSDTGQPVIGHYGYPTTPGRLVLSEFAILPIRTNGIVDQCLAVEHLDARLESFPGEIEPMRAPLPAERR
jgi:hypothetical protein